MPSEGRDLSSKVNVRSGDSREIGVSLVPPVKVGKLQETLHAKAKRAPTYRFYALYDKVYRLDVLWHAYQRWTATGAGFWKWTSGSLRKVPTSGNPTPR